MSEIKDESIVRDCVEEVVDKHLADVMEWQQHYDTCGAVEFIANLARLKVKTGPSEACISRLPKPSPYQSLKRCFHR